ncbi:MAG TPA: hypothetical protein VLB86_01825 [Gaiellaceae bacterium]|nr:hypothetical protein [Gaiellaceae bacterium]
MVAQRTRCPQCGRTTRSSFGLCAPRAAAKAPLAAPPAVKLLGDDAW